MAGHTNRLSLYKPGGGSTGVYVPDEQADIDKINSNMDVIDAAIGGPSFTSVTRPATPYDGQMIFETDTKNIKVFSATLGTWQSASASARGTGADFVAATPAALHAFTSQAVAGDTAYLVGDGTSFAQATFVFNGAGKWASPNVQFINAVAAPAAFVTYLNLGVNTSLLLAGGTGINLINGQPMAYAIGPAIWRYVAGTIPVIPTAATGTGVVLSPDGVVTLTAATAPDIRGIFTGEFDVVEMDFDITISAAAYLSAQFTAAGTPHALTYAGQALNAIGAAPGAGAGSTILMQLMPATVGAGLSSSGTVRFTNANKAAFARWVATGMAAVTSTTTNVGMVGGSHATNGPYDGLLCALQGGGNMTGTFRFRGVNNN